MNTTKSSGFGLLEVLIAAGIIALIAGATVALATSAIHNSLLSLNRTNATQLAQEGVELVRQMRDTTYIDGVANKWNQNPVVAAGDPSIPAVCSTTGCALVQNGNTWQLVAGTQANQAIPVTTGQGTTTFTRVITVVPISWYNQANTGVPNSGSSLAVQVKSAVSWQQDGRTISVDSSTFLTDWRPVQ